jgi:hypothetical protein
MKATTCVAFCLAAIVVCGNLSVSVIQAGQSEPIVAVAAGTTIFDLRNAWTPAALECGSLLPLCGRNVPSGDAFDQSSVESGSKL